MIVHGNLFPVGHAPRTSKQRRGAHSIIAPASNGATRSPAAVVAETEAVDAEEAAQAVEGCGDSGEFDQSDYWRARRAEARAEERWLSRYDR